MAELFKVSQEEIERCVRIIGRAGTDPSTGTIKKILEQLRPTLAKLHSGDTLQEDIRTNLERGTLEDAVSLLRAHDRSRKFLSGGLLMWAGLPIGAVAIGVVVMVASGFIPRADGAYGIAMQELNSCNAVTDRLGQQVEQKRWGGAWGSSTTKGGQWGNAQWSIPVAGSKATGRYSYAAELHGGAWRILRASLQVGEDTIGVVPCSSGWLAKTIETGKNSKPLLQSFGEVGTAGKVSGNTRVKSGDTCEVSITPVAGFQKTTQYNCRVIVRCGLKVIYGWENAGFLICETDRGLPIRANDPWGTAKDTDPMIEVDLPNSRVIVSDDNPDSTYSITIALPANGK